MTASTTDATVPRVSLLFRLLGSRLPRSNGQLRVEGLDGRLTIRRDSWGIPHVEAASEADAWFGLGFCHAQDRAFQLETILRVGRGSLAALVGPNGLPADRMSRRLGFHQLAAAQLPLLDPGVRAAAEAYAHGVNGGLTRGLRRRPHEHVLLRVRPTPWEVTDVLAFGALQAFALSSNWDSELARLKILAEDGPDALADLDPVYPSWLPVTVPVAAAAGAPVDRLATDLAAFAAAAPSGGGSNAWAIAGSHTASGKPLLANDPHLSARLPAPWYLVHLRCPDWQVAGASFVGAPALPIGHNGTAAWGITAALTDQADLFIEEIGPDGDSVREGDRFAPCEVRRERIEVRGGGAVEEVVLVTPRGPIVSPFLDGAPTALSLSAVWLRPLPIRGFLDCVRARDFESFRAAFADWPGPALNLVYADATGRIGYQLVGQLPLRRRGYGTLPLPGWETANGWHDEHVPFDEMPCLADPPEGFVATANNQPARDGDGPFLGVDFVDGYRQARIVEALAARHAWDAAACGELQLDITCLPWRELRETALVLPVTDETGRLGIELLAAWDAQVAADSAAASVYELWLAELSERVAKARAPAAWQWALGAGFGEVVPHTVFNTRSVGRLVRLLREQPEGWFDHDWPVEAADALSAAVRRLQVEHGADPAGWAWGHLRTLTLRHPVGGQPRLAGTFNLGPVPLGGDGNTPMQAFSGPLDPLANPGFLANVRAVIDLADLDGGRWVLAGGQSGNPRS
ncbi:MAG TPA: penicillin acylase family protein, partial [Candidatus Dormibacteraeota bacterium]|nr:penicillin acylase family protein [Candidatus Dormibacteraeota bacterium]